MSPPLESGGPYRITRGVSDAVWPLRPGKRKPCNFGFALMEQSLSGHSSGDVPMWT